MTSLLQTGSGMISARAGRCRLAIRFWSWKHDLANNVSTWTHWWSNGQRRLESSWDTNAVARDLPIRHFRGLVANGATRHWDANGQEVGVYMFLNGSLNQTSQQQATRWPTEPSDAQ